MNYYGKKDFSAVTGVYESHELSKSDPRLQK